MTVELSELAFADPSLMLDLAMLARRLRKAGLELRLQNAQPDITALIEYVGVHRLEGVQVLPAPVARRLRPATAGDGGSAAPLA